MRGSGERVVPIKSSACGAELVMARGGYTRGGHLQFLGDRAGWRSEAVAGGQGAGRAAPPPGPAAKPSRPSRALPLPTAVMWPLAARASQEEGLKIIARSYYPFKRQELPWWGILVTNSLAQGQLPAESGSRPVPWHSLTPAGPTAPCPRGHPQGQYPHHMGHPVGHAPSATPSFGFGADSVEFIKTLLGFRTGSTLCRFAPWVWDKVVMGAKAAC